MLDLYFAPTPNGLKLKLFFEETGLAHRVIPIDLDKGEQHEPAFLAVSPNNKIPALVDHAPSDGGDPINVFESGAILLYLAEKYGLLMPADVRGRTTVMQWLFWQVGGLGPMNGQAGHFRAYAPEIIPYAIDRYTRETQRLFKVMDTRLGDVEYLGGDFSIADIASYPWVVPYTGLGQDLDNFPHLQRWFKAIAVRPATQRTYVGVESVYETRKSLSAEERKALFGTPSE